MHKYYSQCGTILRGLRTGPQKVSFFQKGNHFVGYKANTRLNELVHEGLVVHSDDEKGENGRTFAIYSLTELGKDYKIPEPTLLERIKHAFNF